MARRRKGSGRQWLGKTAYIIIFSVTAFWILAVFAVVFHSMHQGTFHNNAAAESNSNINKSGPAAGGAQRLQRVPKQPHELVKPRPLSGDLDSPKNLSPLIIFTCKRADYLKQTLSQVLEYLPQTCEIGCPLIISQDGYDTEVKKVIETYKERYQDLVPIVHIQHEPSVKNIRKPADAYTALSHHYGWALDLVFSGSASSGYPLPERIIILEEDLHVSPDFFQYFAHMAPLLDQDKTLLSVSAFNDNGKEGLVKDATRVLRSDFFPGLGWMMTRRLWEEELSGKWPGAYWDDWLREPVQRQGRHILRPEVSRTFHFGVKGGASHNEFGGALSSIRLNDNKVDWSSLDLSYLKNTMTFDRAYFSLISMAQIMGDDVKKAVEESKSQDVRLEYDSFPQFQRLATQLHLMIDEKARIPRTAYRGVVETRPHGEYLLFLTPPLEALKGDFQIR